METKEFENWLIEYMTHGLEQEITMNRGNYIIGSLDRFCRFSAAANPMLHTTVEAVRKEAERLAKLDTSKSFVVLEVKGIVEASGVNWK